MVFAEPANIVPLNPEASVAGQPGAMESPGFVPVKVNVNCEHAACAIAPKLSDAVPIRKTGEEPPPVAFTAQEPDCGEAKPTVNVLALVSATDFGRIHSGGVLLSKHANTIAFEFRLWVSVTEVTALKLCW